MTALPRAGGIDESLALLREGYAYIGNRCRRLGSDMFETRLLGQPTICMIGAENARLFYDTGRMRRHGAMPAPVKSVLLGNGGVQGLDDAAHRHRKALFMDLMSPEAIERLAGLTAAELGAAAGPWQRGEQLVLLDAIREPLFRAVCRWSGVPLPPDEADPRSRDMAALFTDSATWRYWRGWQARRRSDAWANALIEQFRNGHLHADPDTPLARIADHRRLDGARLDPRVAGVELLNLLRPTVAVSIYIVFAALALHEYPDARADVLAGGEPGLDRFVAEVRRFYPFFPCAAARVRQTFRWRSFEFPAGRRVLLDLYGTNHDSNHWEAPDEFRPARFAGWEPDAFELIPQGGGSHDVNHRCAGEWITLELMKTAVRFLTRDLDYRVPNQDLDVPLDRMPTYPNSGFVITDVRLREYPGR